MLYDMIGLIAAAVVVILYFVYRKHHHYGSAKFDHDFPDAQSEEAKLESDNDCHLLGH